MGFDDPCFARFRRRHDPHAARFGASVRQGITLEELDREHFVRLRMPEPFQPFAEGGFGTPTASATSTPRRSTTRRRWNRGTATPICARKYPLELISPKNDDSMNSTFGHRDAVDRETATLHLNAADAARLGIHDDDPVRVYNDRGSCVLIARDRWRGAARAWSARPPCDGASARRASAASTRSPPSASPTPAAAPRFIVAWFKWRESETDEQPYDICRVAAMCGPALLVPQDVPTSKKVPVKETVEEAPTAPKLLSAVNMGDPKRRSSLSTASMALKPMPGAGRRKILRSRYARQPVRPRKARRSISRFPCPQVVIDKLKSRHAFGLHQRNRARARNLIRTTASRYTSASSRPTC